MKASRYFTEWQEKREPLLKRSTYEAESIYITRHIAPYFEGKELEELRAPHIHSYAMEKLRAGRRDGKGGLSLVSVKKHLSVIRHALRDAVLLGYIDSNPADNVRLKRRKTALTPRTVFLTTSDAQVLLDGVRGSEIAPAVILALYYGLRRSEVLGLRWSAIDFERNTLTVCHTVVKNLTIEASDTTKSETSRRTFELLPEVKTMLEGIRSDHGGESSYILHRANGEPMRPDTLTRTFKRELSRIGLPPMRFHDLRHSTATLLMERGWSLEDVKNWLGHADIETTSNIYIHYSRQKKVMLAGNLSGMFKIS